MASTIELQQKTIDNQIDAVKRYQNENDNGLESIKCFERVKEAVTYGLNTDDDFCKNLKPSKMALNAAEIVDIVSYVFNDYVETKKRHIQDVSRLSEHIVNASIRKQSYKSTLAISISKMRSMTTAMKKWKEETDNLNASLENEKSINRQLETDLKLKDEKISNFYTVAQASVDHIDSLERKSDLKEKEVFSFKKKNEELESCGTILRKEMEVLKMEINEKEELRRKIKTNLEQAEAKLKKSNHVEAMLKTEMEIIKNENSCLKTEISKLKLNHEETLKVLKAQENELNNMRSDLSMKEIELENADQVKDQEISKLERKCIEITKDLEAKKMQIDKLRSELQLKQLQLEDVTKAKDREILKMRKTYDEISKESEVKKKQIDKLSVDLKMKLGKIEDVIKEKDQEISSHKIKNEDLMAKLKQIEISRSDLKRKNRQIEDETVTKDQEISRVQERCEKLLQNSMEKESLIESLRSNMKMKHQQLADLVEAKDREMSKLSTELENLKSKMSEEYQALKEKYLEKISKLKDLVKERTEIIRKYEGKLRKIKSVKLKQAKPGNATPEVVNLENENYFDEPPAACEKESEGSIINKLSNNLARIDDDICLALATKCAEPEIIELDDSFDDCDPKGNKHGIADNFEIKSEQVLKLESEISQLCDDDFEENGIELATVPIEIVPFIGQDSLGFPAPNSNLDFLVDLDLEISQLRDEIVAGK